MFVSRISKIARINQFIKPNQLLTCSRTLPCYQKRTKSDLYEPDYLISMEPDEPVYGTLNLQLKGYDFALLEASQKQIHRYAEIMGIQVEDSWATPAQQLKVQRFQPGGAVVDAEYQLSVYERNIQVVDVPAWALGSLLRAARGGLAAGVSLALHEHAPEHDEMRFVPDNQLLELKTQLQDMGGPRADKKRRK